MPAPIPTNPDALGTSFHFATYASAAAPIDCIAEGKSPCRAIRSDVDGTLVVRRASDNTQITLRFKAGETQIAACNGIESGTATNFTVFW